MTVRALFSMGVNVSGGLYLLLSIYKETERKSILELVFFLLANKFYTFKHFPLFCVEVVFHCSLLRTCRARVEEKEEFLFIIQSYDL